MIFKIPIRLVSVSCDFWHFQFLSLLCEDDEKLFRAGVGCFWVFGKIGSSSSIGSGENSELLKAPAPASDSCFRVKLIQIWIDCLIRLTWSKIHSLSRWSRELWTLTISHEALRNLNQFFKSCWKLSGKFSKMVNAKNKKSEKYMSPKRLYTNLDHAVSLYRLIFLPLLDFLRTFQPTNILNSLIFCEL